MRKAIKGRNNSFLFFLRKMPVVWKLKQKLWNIQQGLLLRAAVDVAADSLYSDTNLTGMYPDLQSLRLVTV